MGALWPEVTPPSLGAARQLSELLLTTCRGTPDTWEQESAGDAGLLAIGHYLGRQSH